MAALFGTPAAFAATPDQIYRDFADDSRLDGSYSVNELQAALQSPVVQGYGEDEVVSQFRPTVETQIAAQQPPLETVQESDSLPFTGLDLALLTAGGMFLLAFGVSLRRLAKAKR